MQRPAPRRLLPCAALPAYSPPTADERSLLADLTQLSAEVERIGAASSYRFGAARAYDTLVRSRVEELREVRVQGLQTIEEFLARRLAPAMRTCVATAERLEALSGRLSRASELLRTRVDIQLEAQNSALLRSMNRRARLQLRLAFGCGCDQDRIGERRGLARGTRRGRTFGRRHASGDVRCCIDCQRFGRETRQRGLARLYRILPPRQICDSAVDALLIDQL